MTAPNPAPRAEHSPLPWKAQRWWESAGMTLDDASDAEERAEWERCKITRIEGANGETVSAAHDLAYIEPADADLIVLSVNTRPALVARVAALEAALKDSSRLLEVLERDGTFADVGKMKRDRVRASIERARAALALAEQGD